MPDPVLHYLHDPLCGWCHAAAPMVQAVADAGVTLSLHGGGLWPESTELTRSKAAYIRENDERIADLTGQTFGTTYTNELLLDPGTVFWSLPPIAAILAAERVEVGADPRMLREIQFAHYLNGRRVVEPEVLADIAVEIGLEKQPFLTAFNLRAAADHIEQTRALMERHDLHGFPSFLLEAGPTLRRIDHEDFYGRPSFFAAAVVRAARTILQPHKEFLS